MTVKVSAPMTNDACGPGTVAGRKLLEKEDDVAEVPAPGGRLPVELDALEAIEELEDLAEDVAPPVLDCKPGASVSRGAISEVEKPLMRTVCPRAGPLPKSCFLAM